MTTELKIYQLEEFLDNYLNGQKRVYQTVKDDEGNDKKMYIKKDLRKVYTINEYFEYFLNKIQNMKVDALEFMERNELERDDEIQVGNLNIDNKVSFLRKNESAYIPSGVKHRLSNPDEIPLILIEVQSGSYLAEDDIVRFEDIYGRSTH